MTPTASNPSTGSPVVVREALDYLDRVLRPELDRAGSPVVRRALRSALQSGDIVPLGQLAERHRRELLETLDGRLGRGRWVPTPRALVCLTSVLAGIPEPPRTRAVPTGSPAR